MSALQEPNLGLIWEGASATSLRRMPDLEEAFALHWHERSAFEVDKLGVGSHLKYKIGDLFDGDHAFTAKSSLQLPAQGCRTAVAGGDLPERQDEIEESGEVGLFPAEIGPHPAAEERWQRLGFVVEEHGQHAALGLLAPEHPPMDQVHLALSREVREPARLRAMSSPPRQRRRSAATSRASSARSRPAKPSSSSAAAVADLRESLRPERCGAGDWPLGPGAAVADNAATASGGVA